MENEYILLLTLGALAIVFVSAGRYVEESFKDIDTNRGYPTDQLCAPPLTTLPQLSGPADATLENPRRAYHLLGDFLEPATNPDEPPRTANLTSECAYIADGQRRIELTGTYGQITNNYKKSKPDNGSTLLRDLSLSFYK